MIISIQSLLSTKGNPRMKVNVPCLWSLEGLAYLDRRGAVWVVSPQKIGTPNRSTCLTLKADSWAARGLEKSSAGIKEELGRWKCNWKFNHPWNFYNFYLSSAYPIKVPYILYEYIEVTV